jgi:mannose-6-phosphate isomerase
MTVELAAIHFREKAWGRTTLLPWSSQQQRGQPIGEMCFEPQSDGGRKPSLLFKILFTSAALSIQVHPDDLFACRIGLGHGKSEAWYVLSAEPGARVALGLTRAMTRRSLRDAILDGSIETLVKWQSVQAGDIIAVPPGTIHAIGPGLVIAEIQQNSDLTYRLFDYGSSRELHVDQAMAVAHAEIFKPQTTSEKISQERTALVIADHFVLEYIEVPPDAARAFNGDQETWILVLAGQVAMDGISATQGEALMLDRTNATLQAGTLGLTALVAYAAPFVVPDLLRPLQGAAERSTPTTSHVLSHHE